jgi:hypothetical protein
MLALLPIAILLLTPVAMTAVRFLRPAFAYFWLIAASGVILAWLGVIGLFFRLPLSVPLITWQPVELFPGSPSLLIDQYSWPLALALSSVALAVIFSAVVRIPHVNWRAWAGTLGLVGLALIAIFAGNPLTLLLAWSALDLTEMVVLLLLIRSSALRERVVITFSARIAGVLILLWATLSNSQLDSVLQFSELSSQASFFLLIAAGLRLGVLPFHIPLLQEAALRRGLGTTLRIAAPAASLILLIRAALSGIEAGFTPYLLTLAGFSALFSAASWLAARDELAGRQYWVLGTASLSVGAAILGLPSASLAWGLVLLLPGSLIFLTSARHIRLAPLAAFGLWGISGLPFSPAWEGVRIYGSSFPAAGAAFLLAHALLMAGYIRHYLQPGDMPKGAERWVWFLYPAGLAVLPLAHIFSGIYLMTSAETMPAWAWISGGVAGALAFGILKLIAVQVQIRISFLQALRSFFSLNWLYIILWQIYRAAGRLISWITGILEGEGGVLWALVLLAILFSLMTQGHPGE